MLPSVSTHTLGCCNACAGDFLSDDPPRIRRSAQGGRPTEPVAAANGATAPGDDLLVGAPLTNRQNQPAGTKRPEATRKAPVRKGRDDVCYNMTVAVSINICSALAPLLLWPEWLPVSTTCSSQKEGDTHLRAPHRRGVGLQAAARKARGEQAPAAPPDRGQQMSLLGFMVQRGRRWRWARRSASSRLSMDEGLISWELQIDALLETPRLRCPNQVT